MYIYIPTSSGACFIFAFWRKTRFLKAEAEIFAFVILAYFVEVVIGLSPQYIFRACDEKCTLNMSIRFSSPSAPISCYSMVE